MRFLTDDEKDALHRGCIFCKGEDYLLGPSALGLAYNVYCSECRAGFNITHEKMPWQVIAQPGEISESQLDELTKPKLMMADAETMLDYVRTSIITTLRQSLPPRTH